jgi:D-alanine--poly(phosphoribitol) ligase subunit 1
MFFEELASADLTRRALAYPEQNISFGRLLAHSEQLAALLLSKNLRRGDVVAIGHDKRPLSYALMLAALRLGIPYVNIDVASPTDRNARILQTAGPRILFYDNPAYEQEIKTLARLAGCEATLLEEAALPSIGESDRRLQDTLVRQVDGACIAYIMFTSGSTGVPKGVAVTHQNVLHLVEWGKSCFEVTDKDIFANLSPMYFDNSVFDFYVGLFSGAALAPVSRELLAAPYELVEHVRTMECSIWFSVPSLLIYLTAMKALSAERLPALRTIAFGGEGYPKPELKKLYDMFRPQARLVNVYGPTECTCICSAYPLGDDDFADLEGLPTLGRLNQNFDHCILDEEGAEASSGELCLIGPNVSAGYFNDPERTDAAFLTLTEPRRFMKRMYRTGDLVREHEGMLYFLGRKDNQIKHMGYRIELEEIEHGLVRLPQIDQAAVLYQRSNVAYGKIVAFAACKEAADEKALLRDLAQLLPSYMIPAKLVIMEELPKNPNGKVDRQKLKASLNG